jgi:NTP pyrophosphatase (non-canonical NTP hydrolase)
MLKDAQEAVRKISGDYHKKNVTTSAFFHSLIAEQLGQVAHSYMHGGRLAKDIDVDIADVILCSLAYLNWLDKEASAAFEKSLKKHGRAIDEWKRKKR